MNVGFVYLCPARTSANSGAQLRPLRNFRPKWWFGPICTPFHIGFAFMVYQMSNLDIVSNLIVAMLLLNSDNGPPKEMLTTCTVFLWSSCNPAAWTGRESGSKFRHIILIEQPSGSIYRPNGLTHPQRAPRTRPICVILRSSMAQTSIFM